MQNGSNRQVLLIIAICITLLKCLNAVPDPVVFHTQLELGPDLNMSWTQNNTFITFELRYNSSYGYVVFGFNQTSGNSDVIVAWLNPFDGCGHFSDRTLTNSTNTLDIDAVQSYTLLDAYISNDVTIIKFFRTVAICDLNVDNYQFVLGQGSNNIVYYLGQTSDINFDNDNVTFEMNSVVTYPSENVNILSQTSGPFTCPPTDNTVITFNSAPTATYANVVDFVPGVYRFHWNYTSTDVIGEIHVLTNGWVGFGLSPTGGMDQSDVIVGWINNGVNNFTHRHIVDRSVIIDSSPLWKLLYMGQVNGYLIIKFTRPITSCDQYVRTIDPGTPLVIFAYGLTAPSAGQDITYHGATRRGSLGVNLINGPKYPDISYPNQETIEFKIANAILPAVDYTSYYCKVFEIPTQFQSPKRHIFKWEIILSQKNLLNMHHMLVQECAVVNGYQYNGDPYIRPGICDKNLAHVRCPVVSKLWAIGAETVQFYPTNTGYPIGGDAGYKYLMVQVHYTNPNYDIGFIPDMRIKYYMTQTLQPNELAMLMVGANMFPTYPYTIALPPKVNNLGLYTYCTNDCTSQYLSQQNMTIVFAAPHTHLVGTQIHTKIYRKGVDIGYLFNNKNYDFNFQRGFILNEPVTITKDDTLMTYCQYNTMSRDKITTAGESTLDEMCFQFFAYYPRTIGLYYCTSGPSYKDFVSLLSNLKSSGDISTYVSSSNVATTIADFFANQTTFNNNTKNSFANFYKTTKIVNSCNYRSNQASGEIQQPTPQNTWIETDKCSVTNTNNHGERLQINDHFLPIYLLIALLTYICL